jgi:hypothetical protein
MAVSRCNKCGVVTEHPMELVGTVGLCVGCGTSNMIHDTVFFMTQIMKRFMALQNELILLKNPAGADPSTDQQAAEQPADIDIHNTDMLTSELQHSAISKWFREKGISVSLNTDAVDTTGFFDEAAVEIGNRFSVLGEVVDRIRYAQQKGFESALIHLDKKSEAEAKSIKAFCKQLYDYSLVARYLNNKEEKNVRVVLQAAPMVRRFFAGDWLEWFALVEALKLFSKRKLSYSCARNLLLTLPNAEKYELDVFFMLNGSGPVYIECKSGEYRSELDKYVALRKKLGISPKRFIICVVDLEQEQAKGLGAMYGLTFVGASELVPYLETLC